MGESSKLGIGVANLRIGGIGVANLRIGIRISVANLKIPPFLALRWKEMSAARELPAAI